MTDILRPDRFRRSRERQETIPNDMSTSFGLVVVKDGKILLIKPRGANFWEIPKGGAEVVREEDDKVVREPGHTAATRETEEETGISATPTDSLGFVKDTSNYKAVVAYLADYKGGLIDAESGRALNIQRSEVDQAKFFEPEEALDVVVDYLKPIISRAINSMSESSKIDSIIDEVLTIGSVPAIGRSSTSKYTRGYKRRTFYTHSDCVFYTDDIPKHVKVNIRDVEGWCKRYKEKVKTFDKATRSGKPCPSFKARNVHEDSVSIGANMKVMPPWFIKKSKKRKRRNAKMSTLSKKDKR